MLKKSIEDLIFRKIAPQSVRHLAPPVVDRRDPLLRALYDQVSEEFQLAPPLTIHASDPDLLAGYWHATRETYAVGRAGRAKREAVAAAVSSLNRCPYCETVHGGMFAAAGGGRLDADSPLMADIRAAETWAEATLSPGSEVLANPRINRHDTPQIFGTAAMFHYTNRMVSVFLDESPMPLPGLGTKWGKKVARQAMALIGRRMSTVEVPPGRSAVKKAADLPKEFNWSSGQPHVAAGLAHFAKACEDAGAAAVPKEVRTVVRNHLALWKGEPVPLSRAWLTEPLASLSDRQRPIARLILLTARAPWQVDERVIAEIRASVPSDRQLLQIVAWAAFTATRRIAGWFPVPSSESATH